MIRPNRGLMTTARVTSKTAPSVEPPKGWANLIADLVHTVAIEFLDMDDSARCATVCKSWERVLKLEMAAAKVQERYWQAEAAVCRSLGILPDNFKWPGVALQRSQVPPHARNSQWKSDARERVRSACFEHHHS